MAIIHSIYRYPVKGLSPEALPRIALAPGETVPGDRLYAIENGPSGFDPSAPAYLSKQHFLMLMKNERLARLDTDRATVATQLTDLETAERVLMRVGKTPPGRRPTSAAAAEAKAPTATRGRLGRPPKAATSKSAGRKLSAPSLGERVLALATGKTRQELYAACPSDRPNHVGMAVQRHIRAGRIQERDGKLYATPTATEQAHATA